ncbi:SymE family type I addiction module toxin [Pectobacterium polaris]|uniref:SymE family type I addiction module toxin n=1 Tax=Pectobacterium polaris TaxID=2042057 RepID=UPI0032E42E06
MTSAISLKGCWLEASGFMTEMVIMVMVERGRIVEFASGLLSYLVLYTKLFKSDVQFSFFSSRYSRTLSFFLFT